MRRYVLGNAQSEDGVVNDKGMMGDKFYWLSVVGNNTYFKHTKMGGRTSLFLTSQRMPSRYNAYINTYNCINKIII